MLINIKSNVKSGLQKYYFMVNFKLKYSNYENSKIKVIMNSFKTPEEIKILIDKLNKYVIKWNEIEEELERIRNHTSQ